MFDNGAFSEDHTLSISDWLAHTPPAIVSQNLGLGTEWAAKLPKEETYFAEGAVPDDSFARAAPRAKPMPFQRAHRRYPLGAQQPQRVPGGGVAVEGYRGRVPDLDHIVPRRAGDRAGRHARASLASPRRRVAILS